MIVSAFSALRSSAASRSFSSSRVIAARALDEFANVSMLQSETPERIEEIWTSYHGEKKDSNVIGAALAASTYYTLAKNAAKSPLFVVPVPREGGYMVMISQMQAGRCLFAFLEEFRQDPAAAEPYLALEYFDDLAEQSDLVLCRGEIGRGKLTRDEADQLRRMVEGHYGDDRLYAQTVEAFNHRPGEFDFEAHLAECVKVWWEEQPSSTD